MVFNSIKQIGGCLLQVIQKTELEYFSCFLTSMTLFRSVIGNQIGVNTNLRNGMVRGHNSFLGTSTKTHSMAKSYRARKTFLAARVCALRGPRYMRVPAMPYSKCLVWSPAELLFAGFQRQKAVKRSNLDAMSPAPSRLPRCARNDRILKVVQTGRCQWQSRQWGRRSANWC
jgi:hypothetical protein